jgi:hypothetical protein
VGKKERKKGRKEGRMIATAIFPQRSFHSDLSDLGKAEEIFTLIG